MVNKNERMMEMERLAMIVLSSSILLIPERVLWKYLPGCEIEAGRIRGKAYAKLIKAKKEKAGSEHRILILRRVHRR